MLVQRETEIVEPESAVLRLAQEQEIVDEEPTVSNQSSDENGLREGNGDNGERDACPQRANGFRRGIDRGALSRYLRGSGGDHSVPSPG